MDKQPALSLEVWSVCRPLEGSDFVVFYDAHIPTGYVARQMLHFHVALMVSFAKKVLIMQI